MFSVKKMRPRAAVGFKAVQKDPNRCLVAYLAACERASRPAWCGHAVMDVTRAANAHVNRCALSSRQSYERASAFPFPLLRGNANCVWLKGP
jgi:hypothetical protein